MPEPLHPTDALQDALDGRLDAEARASLDAHLATCAQCRRELDALRWTKTQVAALGRSGDAAEGLDDQIRHALDEEDRRSTPGSPQTPRFAIRSGRWAGWAAAAAVIVVAIWVGSRIVGDAPPEKAADVFRAFVAGSLPLEMETSDPKALEARLNGAGFNFWQEGSTVCVLVADGDPEAAIKLAFAKAVRI